MRKDRMYKVGLVSIEGKFIFGGNLILIIQNKYFKY